MERSIDRKVKDIVDMYTIGNDVDCIAKTVNTTKQMVIAILKQNGIYREGQVDTKLKYRVSISSLVYTPTLEKALEKLSKAQVDEMVMLHDKGVRIFDLTKKYGMSRNAIVEVLQFRGVDTSVRVVANDPAIRFKLTEEQIKSIIRLREKNYAIDYIAHKVKVTGGAVKGVIEYYGLATRVQDVPEVLTSKDEVEYIINKYNSGVSTTKIAKELHVSVQLVNRRLRESGVEIRTQATSNETIDEILRLHKLGVASNEIAKQLNIGMDRVLTVVNKYRSCKKIIN